MVRSAAESLESLLLSLSPPRLAAIRNLTITIKPRHFDWGVTYEKTETANSAYRLLASKCTGLRGLTLNLLDRFYYPRHFALEDLRGLKRIRGLEEGRILRAIGSRWVGFDFVEILGDVDGEAADELRKAWMRPKEVGSGEEEE